MCRQSANHDQEKAVTVAQHAAVRDLLRRGLDVVVDDTLLRQRYAREMRNIATLAGAEFEVKDFTFESIQTCIDRDQARDKSVGEDVIIGMYKRYLAGKPYPLPLPEESDDQARVVPYAPDFRNPRAVIVDIDGTMALIGPRSPYDETRVHEDQPNHPVISVVRAMYLAGYHIIFCSGRKDICRQTTEKWLTGNFCYPYVALHMRRTDDNRKDSIVKMEIFDNHIRNRYNVVAVFDDRRQVVDMWRSMGLTVFQVAPGDF